MKKEKRNLIIFLLVVIALVFIGCKSNGNDDGTTTGGYDTSTLSISNAPSGNLNVTVYKSNTLPKTKAELTSMMSGNSLAGGSGDSSPVTFYWIDKTAESGNHLVVVINSSTIKFALVNFNKNGSGSVNWNTMTDYMSLL